jgi:hypothetical protein
MSVWRDLNHRAQLQSDRAIIPDITTYTSRYYHILLGHRLVWPNTRPPSGQRVMTVLPAPLPPYLPEDTLVQFSVGLGLSAYERRSGSADRVARPIPCGVRRA